MWDVVEELSIKVGEIAYICPVKTAMIRTFTLLLTLSIILSSVGVALSEQICFMTGIKQVAPVAQKDDCCQKPVQEKSADSCCGVDISYEKLEPVSSLKYFHAVQSAAITEAIKFIAFYNPFHFREDKHLFNYTDSSPPLYGRDLLLKINILLI